MSNDEFSVLVVDDSQVLRRMVREALGVLECQVLEAEDGAMGLSMIQENKVDLVILDWHMPQLDGLEMFNEIQKIDRLKRIPVIMLTAEDRKESMLKAIRSGVRYYLTKPFTHEDLLSRVVQVMRLER